MRILSFHQGNASITVILPSFRTQAMTFHNQHNAIPNLPFHTHFVPAFNCECCVEFCYKICQENILDSSCNITYGKQCNFFSSSASTQYFVNLETKINISNDLNKENFMQYHKILINEQVHSYCLHTA